jgi:hypothetical protein
MHFQASAASDRIRTVLERTDKHLRCAYDAIEMVKALQALKGDF